MPPAIGFTLAIVFFLGLPIGLILLVLGLYRRGDKGESCVCGYCPTGLPEGAPCPECGRQLAGKFAVRRVRWQVNLGVVLLLLSCGAALAFCVLLYRALRG